MPSRPRLKQDFAEVYAADLPAGTVAVMAAAQRPVDPAALDEACAGSPTWRSIPSWTLVSTRDNSLPAVAQRTMAKRAGSTVVAVESSHVVPAAHLAETAEIIAAATQTTTAPPDPADCSKTSTCATSSLSGAADARRSAR